MFSSWRKECITNIFVVFYDAEVKFCCLHFATSAEQSIRLLAAIYIEMDKRAISKNFILCGFIVMTVNEITTYARLQLHIRIAVQEA